MERSRCSTLLNRCVSALKASLEYAFLGTFVGLLFEMHSTGFKAIAEVPTAFLTIWALFFCFELAWQTHREPTQSS
jgi:hypothetical protein